MVESEVRVTVTEFAVSRVFLHAGVVAWKNEALVIPAKSYSGKSTLVAELVKKGVVHYSDEYAVLDAAGNVQPFPKWLSLRGIIDPYTQLECSVESIGGIAGAKTISVGIVCTVGLACEYLGLNVEDTPIVDEVKNIPRWLLKTIEKEWKSHLKLVPLHHFLHDKKKLFWQIKKESRQIRLQVTIDMEVEFDNRPRIFYQNGDIFFRLIPAAKRDAKSFIR